VQVCLWYLVVTGTGLTDSLTFPPGSSERVLPLRSATYHSGSGATIRSELGPSLELALFGAPARVSDGSNGVATQPARFNGSSQICLPGLAVEPVVSRSPQIDVRRDST